MFIIKFFYRTSFNYFELVLTSCCYCFSISRMKIMSPIHPFWDVYISEDVPRKSISQNSRQNENHLRIYYYIDLRTF